MRGEQPNGCVPSDCPQDHRNDPGPHRDSQQQSRHDALPGLAREVPDGDSVGVIGFWDGMHCSLPSARGSLLLVYGN